MALTNTVNFLPEVFRSTTNQRFLGATLDQLTSDARNIPVNGYIGRTFAPTYKLGDNYIQETTRERSQYQLEPAVVVKDDAGNVQHTATFNDLLQSIANNNGFVNNQQRLFASEFYNFDGHFDYDKFVNYNNYYWLPDGPDSVTVSSGTTPLTGTFTVTRNAAVGGYTFSGQGGYPNTQLTLVRGGSYKFILNQPGIPFWIQTQEGLSGLNTEIPTLSTRQIYGVNTNGVDDGVLTFNVPLASAQDFYINMRYAGVDGTPATVNAAVTFKYTDIQNQLLSTFLDNFPAGLDGLNNLLNGKAFVFIANDLDDTYWTTPAIPSAFTGSANSDILAGTIIDRTKRTSVWKITLVPSGADSLIQINPVVAVPAQTKVFIGSGKVYASSEFWVNNNLQYIEVPPITSDSDYLFYQDGTAATFAGQIKLVDNLSTPINVDSDIIGATSYVSPNGVIFTNGLKVLFDTMVSPTSYANNEYYVEGVGTSIQLVPVTQLVAAENTVYGIDPNAPDYITINRSAQDLNPWARSNRWFHKDILQAAANYNNEPVNYGPNVPGRRAIIEFEPNLQLFNFGVQYKANVDLFFTAATDAFVQIEGQQSYTYVDPITSAQVPLTQGMRVIFSNDYDTNIVNKIWQVNLQIINNSTFIQLVETADDPVVANESVLVTNPGNATSNTYHFDGSVWTLSQARTGLNQPPLFDLVDVNGISFANSGSYPDSTFAGTKLFSYAVGTGSVNDPALGFPLTYQNFNNIGDIVFTSFYNSDDFSYISNTLTGATTTVLCNTGYIVKNTGLSATTKVTDWVTSLDASQQYQVLTGVYQGKNITLNQTTAMYPANYTVAAGTYSFAQIDIVPTLDKTIPDIKVYINNAILNPNTDYQIVSYGVYYLVVFTNMLTVGDKIDVLLFSADSTSSLGYYQVPTNLDLNPLNELFPVVNGTAQSAITLGQMRTHYNKLVENTTVSPTDAIPLRDRYLKAQGGTLVQQSSPLIYAMTFLTDPQLNFVDSINLARNEYTRFKNKFLSLCATLKGLDYSNPVSGVDAILKTINANKNGSFPWYYSDMVAQGDNYTTTTYTVLSTRQTKYEIASIFDITQLSNRAVMVYLNGDILTADHIDYYYDDKTPSVVILKSLNIGDVITIRDYSNTDGNYIPETPVKLGLAQDYPPQYYYDTTYVNPTYVVVGHDGSKTPAFGDFRDSYLLELETRIYNNLKTDYNNLNPFNQYDIIPGRFRTTDYSLAEWNQLLTQNFLQWTGSNSIDYITNQWYDVNNPWTWNYGQFRDSFTGDYLQGSWRAIYNYWFDTDKPHVTPWNMLGFAQKPTWWDQRYGAAPYTSGNTTMWQDLEAGYVWNGSDATAYTDTNFARPGLNKIIPVDTAGNLLDPTRIGIIGKYNPASAGATFAIGQQGPVETAWRYSSDYGFAQQMAFALARPAEYFSTQIELGVFHKNSITGQFSDASNRRVSPSLWYVNGETNPAGGVYRTSGYINWITDYVKNLGINPVNKIGAYFSNLSVQLAYRVGGFTDKKMLTVTAEQTSPGSTNASIIIPDENYSVYLGTPIPIKTIAYSAVVVTKTTAGYSVSGYNTSNPVFPIYASVANNQSSTISVGTVSVQLYKTGSTTQTVIPYGTTFTSLQQVADFLISYERYLVAQGFAFETFDTTLATTRNWSLSIKEFLFWAQQGWAPGTLIVLNPVADKMDVKTNGTIVGEITNLPTGSRILDTNFVPIRSNAFNLMRIDSGYPGAGNLFRLHTVDGTSTIAFAQLSLIQYEHTLVFDNIDDFGDIVYIPEQGTRQFRLKLQGAKTGGWDGALSATGYIYSNPVINAWQPGVDYKQGDLVTFNNALYTSPVDIPASQNFALSNWTRINQEDIQTGLLPSLGHNAQIFQNIYDVDNPPQDENFQTFSAGLIGFRERPFLSNLGMSVTTQTKFYQGYTKQKGTRNAVDALTKATFGTINSTINTYEEWGFQVGQYGDIDNNQFIEFELDDTVFQTNPVAFTNQSTFSNANIIVGLSFNSNLYNTNYATLSSTLYSDRDSSEVYNTDLPSCGFVNTADIDYQVYDITAVSQLPAVVNDGNKVWVANDFGGGWNVYRTNAVTCKAVSLQYTLDSYGVFTFNTSHNLVANEYFVVQGFSAYFDGLYQVISVANSTSVTVAIADVTDLLRLGSSVTGVGNVLVLQSMVVQSDSSIGSNTPPNGWLTGDHQWVINDTNSGATGWAVYTFTAPSTWSRTRQQALQVDITSVNRTFIYNKTNNVIAAALDFIDPIKGKVLNAVGTDIDYQLTTDPAFYNAGATSSPDFYWGPQQVGKIWWDINAVRYIDYEQDQLIYRLNNWGVMFPGSQILVYEWVESTVLPSQYAATYGDGVALYADDSAYSTYGSVTASSLNTKYYFWVVNKTSIAKNKNNSVYSIAAAIENPQAQGIPYMTVLRDDTVALYNVNTALSGTNSILHISSRDSNAGLIHSEYALVQEGNPHSTIPVAIEKKLVDSLAGQDIVGNTVPDPALPPSRAYGVQIRPRQSMFMNRTLALSNYITYVNTIMLAYPVLERKLMTTLNSSQPVPNPDSGSYSFVVASYAELLYVDTNLLTTSEAVLVNSDETNLGKWAIYTWSGSTWSRTQSQSYKTNLYWSTADWYDPSFDPTTTIQTTVANNLEFGKLTLVADTYVKILDNGNGQFIVYYIDSSLNKNLVGIQNGTVQISTGTIPALEMRQIALAIQNDIFVADLAANYNELFFIMIKYALTEQRNLDWVFKTSFLSATQQIRALQQFPSYIADNQTYYLDYINEVKPYRTTVRQFVIDYVGNDQYSGDTTDFDLPPYWDANLQIYRSPNGEQSYDAGMLSTVNGAFSQWYNNYTYSISAIEVTEAGQGYNIAPQVIISGGGGSGAAAYATLDSNGGIASVIVTNPGQGYTSTPSVTFNGTNTSAMAYPVLNNVASGNGTGHNVVRSINTTIKFDRVNYTNANTFVFWSNVSTGQSIAANTILVNNDKLYLLGAPYTVTSSTFPIDLTTQISAATFDNANDRIVAYNGNIDLSITQSGIAYPGVTVDGNTFVGGEFDTTIQSFYGNVFGVNVSDIAIDGGKYISTYSSHSPEELVPGRMYDSLNMSVYDTGGLAFREYIGLEQQLEFFRIPAANTAVLTANLSITDTTIYVDDSSVLANPNPVGAIPGVVFINGEKIVYWSKDDTTNTLSNIRRCADGSAGSNLHPVGSRVVDGSVEQAITTNPFGTRTVTSLSGFQSTDPAAVTYALNLTQPITANMNDTLTQLSPVTAWTANAVFNTNYIYYSGNTYAVSGNIYGPTFGNARVQANVAYAFAGNLLTTVRLQVMQSVTNSKSVPVTVLGGAVQGLPEVFDSNIGFDPGTFSGNGAISSGVANTLPLEFYPGGTVSSAAYLPTFPLAAGALVTGNQYVINGAGTTDWTIVGAPAEAQVNGNISNGTTYLSSGNVLIANIALTPYYGNLKVGTRVTGAGIAANTVITAYTGNDGRWLRKYTVNNAQYVPGTVIITGQPAVGTTFVATTVGTGTGNVTIANGSAFIATDTNHTWVFSTLTNSYTDIGVYSPSETFDAVNSVVYVNGAPTGSYIVDSYIIGTVDNTGSVYIQANTQLQTSQSWYSRGITTATDGRGLDNSTTPVAQFLKESPGIVPQAGTTP